MVALGEGGDDHFIGAAGAADEFLRVEPAINIGDVLKPGGGGTRKRRPQARTLRGFLDVGLNGPGGGGGAAARRLGSGSLTQHGVEPRDHKDGDSDKNDEFEIQNRPCVLLDR